MTFTVEIGDPEAIKSQEHVIEVYIDRSKLRELADDLAYLAKMETGEHLHLFSESWGGDRLNDTATVSGNTICHHLKITLVEEEP